MQQLPESPRIQAVDRALVLLKAVAESDSPQTARDLARVSGLNRSTAWRLLGTLEYHGLVEREVPSNRYRVGAEAIRLASAAPDHSELIRRGGPLFERLAEECEVTVNLNVISHRGVTSIAQFDAPHVLSANWVGRLAPLHASPSGKLALSLMPLPELDRFLEHPLARYTPTTITDPTRLRVELTKIREQGYGSILGEHEEGLNAVAAAVFRHDHAIAYVSAWGPGFRMPETRFPELGERLRSTCRELAEGKPSPHPVPA